MHPIPVLAASELQSTNGYNASTFVFGEQTFSVMFRKLL